MISTSLWNFTPVKPRHATLSTLSFQHMCPLIPLTNQDQNCWLNSVLIALFANKSLFLSYVKDKNTDLFKYLKKFENSIQNKGNPITDSRPFIEFFDNISCGEPYDATEFVHQLFQKLSIAEYCIMVENGKIPLPETESDVILDLTLEDSITIRTIRQTLYTNRRLTAMVMYDGGHYTCYVLCKNVWYHYDDRVEQKFKHIGSFANVSNDISNNNFALSLLFYTTSSTEMIQTHNWNVSRVETLQTQRFKLVNKMLFYGENGFRYTSLYTDTIKKFQIEPNKIHTVEPSEFDPNFIKGDFFEQNYVEKYTVVFTDYFNEFNVKDDNINTSINIILKLLLYVRINGQLILETPTKVRTINKELLNTLQEYVNIELKYYTMIITKLKSIPSELVNKSGKRAGTDTGASEGKDAGEGAGTRVGEAAGEGTETDAGEQVNYVKNKESTVIDGVANYEQLTSIGYNVNPHAYMLDEGSINKSVISECLIGPQVIHVIYINSKASNYSFINKCCGESVESQLNNFPRGVAINTTFFNIGHKDLKRHDNGDRLYYAPIGFFHGTTQDEYSNIYYNIDLNYEPFYRYVCIKNNEISFLQINASVEQIKNQYDIIFAAGPMLIENNQKIYTNENPSLFTCGNFYNNTYITYEYENNKCVQKTKPLPQTAGDCGTSNSIPPGNLGHGSNPNPRSMLITRDNNDQKGDVAFIYIEGRTSHAVGLDFFQQVQLAKFLGATNAINLDGGASSGIAIRTTTNIELPNCKRKRHNRRNQYRYFLGSQNDKKVGAVLMFVDTNS